MSEPTAPIVERLRRPDSTTGAATRASATATAAIETIGLRKSYPLGDLTVEALRGVDLRVDAGGFVAIVGPSGSGKSTLLNLVGCLDRPTGGRVLIDGRDVAGLGDADVTDIRCRRIGYVFQRFYLLPFLTALQNVDLQARLAGLPDRRERALQALRGVGLLERAGHLPRQLSGGEQQRVAIARALVKSPAFILADEPTGNLDTATGDMVAATFARLNEEGTTIVMVTHNPELAALAHRIVRLRDGLVADPATGADGAP